jgi:hypothetical protein
MATGSPKKVMHTVTYIKAPDTKGTFKFVPEDDENSPIVGTLYARKAGAAADLGGADTITVTVTIG